MNFDTPYETLNDHDQRCINSLSRNIIQSLRQITEKPLSELYVKDMLILLDIEKRLRTSNPEEAAKDREWQFFKTVAVETKEFILMNENQEERAQNKRPPKNDFSQDFCYLSEAFEIFFYMFKRYYYQIEHDTPEIPPFIINMQIIQDLAMKKAAKVPSIRKIRVINKHKAFIEKQLKKISAQYGNLPEDLKEQIETPDYFLISLWGSEAIRTSWSQTACLSERTNILAMGTSINDPEKIILEGFPGNDSLSTYIKTINTFLVEAESTETFTGSKTMFASLFYYLIKFDLAANYQPFRKTSNLNKMFSIFSEYSNYEGT